MPTTVITGQTLKGTISGVLTNTSSDIQKGTAFVAIYEYDGTTTALINSQKFNLNLKPGKSVPYHVKIKGQVTLSAGSYSLYPYAIDVTQNYNPATQGAPLDVQARVITLSATAITPVKPATVKTGKTGNYTVTLTNSGNVDTSDLATIELGLSVDGVTESVSLSNTSKKYKIKAGKPLVLHLQLKLPKTITPGTYYSELNYTQNDVTASVFGTTPFTITD